MIIDKIENRGCYALPKPLAEALEYMASADLAHMELGEHRLPNGLTLDVDEYVCKSDWKNFEGHDYITHLRYVVSGSEKLGYANKEDVTYIETKKKDKMSYSGEESKVRVTAGSFVVLFPQDCHAVKLIDHEGTLVRKASVSLNTAPEEN